MRRDRREQDFTEFYLARGPALRRTAYLIVRDWHTAEDPTQQAFVRLYAAWPRVLRDSADAYAPQDGGERLPNPPAATSAGDP